MIVNLNIIISPEEDERIPDQAQFNLCEDMRDHLLEMLRHWHQVGKVDDLSFVGNVVVTHDIDVSDLAGIPDKTGRSDLPDEDISSQN